MKKEFILVEWIDKEELYHSGVYPIEDKIELEKKLNEWASLNRIKSYNIIKYEGIIASQKYDTKND